MDIEQFGCDVYDIYIFLKILYIYNIIKGIIIYINFKFMYIFRCI